MQQHLKIRHIIRLSFASLVRIQLAFAVALLFMSAPAPHPVAAGTSAGSDKTVKIEKTVEALHVDFSSKINVPSAPEGLLSGFYLLPEQLHFVATLVSLYTVYTQFPGVCATNPFYRFVSINAP